MKNPYLAATLIFLLATPAIPAHSLKETGNFFLEEYAKIHEALVSDRTDGVVEAASRIARTAREMAGHAEANEKAIYEALALAASKVQGTSIESLRQATRELSVALDRALRAGKVEGWFLLYCPMAEGYWIQKEQAVRNPYYGKSMLRCGEIVPAVKGS